MTTRLLQSFTRLLIDQVSDILLESDSLLEKKDSTPDRYFFMAPHCTHEISQMYVPVVVILSELLACSFDGKYVSNKNTVLPREIS